MIIYAPKGKALEYSPLAANLYKGCSHGCEYCFAPKATFTDRQVFSSDEYIRPRPDVMEQFTRDAFKLSGSKKPVLLSFTTDPYQPAEEKYKLTRQALNILWLEDIPATVLTKGGTRACKDFDILARKKENAFSVTLTTDDPGESIKWEPGAALPADRIEALKIAHSQGIKTWVSFEPVFNTDAVIRLIGETHTFVDLYKIGKLNYHPVEKTIDWSNFLSRTETELDRYHKNRYIKIDLEAYRSKTAA
jgi:DNA repair photolyase